MQYFSIIHVHIRILSKYNSKLLSKDICFLTCVRTGPEGNEPAPVVQSLGGHMTSYEFIFPRKRVEKTLDGTRAHYTTRKTPYNNEQYFTIINNIYNILQLLRIFTILTILFKCLKLYYNVYNIYNIYNINNMYNTSQQIEIQYIQYNGCVSLRRIGNLLYCFMFAGPAKLHEPLMDKVYLSSDKIRDTLLS